MGPVDLVMRVTTLKASTTAGGLDGLLAYYAGLAEDRERPGRGRGPVDYYLDPNEPPGRWRGEGLSALGLRGEVSGADLRALLQGDHPVTGDRLGRGFGLKSARGFDATFSAPKSVSALWALSPDPWIRAEVLAAHDAAVDAALGWFESQGAVTRRGRDGVLQVDTQGIAVATFRQHTSRAVDPQLHTHAVMAAKVQDRSGRWLSLDARFLKYQQRTIGWIYDAALRTELTSRLGVAWTPADDGPSDMVCVPAPVRDVLSQRSAQVADKLAELIGRWSAENDGTEPDPRTIALLERRAARTSRPSKSHPSDPAGLHEGWRDQARGVGFDPDQLTVGSIAGRIFEQDVSDEELIEEALRRVADEQACWLRADIARQLATLIGPTDAADAGALVERIDELAAQADALCQTLGPTRGGTSLRRDGRPLIEHVTDRLLTTPAVLDEESRLQAWAERNAREAFVDCDPQRSAVAAIAGQDRLVLVVGPAGTGKTRAIATAVGSLYVQRRPVVGLAPSGKAADVLRAEAGCDADTVAGFVTLHQNRFDSPWRAGTTVVLDEAAMVRTDDLAALVDLVERHGWRLVAVGDPAQLPAVGRGGVFAHWTNTIPHHRLDTPRRSPNPGKPPPRSASAPETLRPSTPTTSTAGSTPPTPPWSPPPLPTTTPPSLAAVTGSGSPPTPPRPPAPSTSRSNTASLASTPDGIATRHADSPIERSWWSATRSPPATTTVGWSLTRARRSATATLGRSPPSAATGRSP
jgi:conjugative relaxase-like TrwC/TraI family protein